MGSNIQCCSTLLVYCPILFLAHNVPYKHNTRRNSVLEGLRRKGTKYGINTENYPWCTNQASWMGQSCVENSTTSNGIEEGQPTPRRKRKFVGMCPVHTKGHDFKGLYGYTISIII